jgi:hypothetical protein
MQQILKGLSEKTKRQAFNIMKEVKENEISASIT